MDFIISDQLHEDYRDETRRVLGALLDEYPMVTLRAVEMYEEPGDRSLGHAEHGVISLNAYWFSRPRRVFVDAVIRARETTPPGFPRWHGGIGGIEQEYERLLTHEFAHLLKAVIGSAADEFTRDSFAAALADPVIAVSGYALTDAEEWWAETFDALRLGGARGLQVHEMRRFLEWAL